MDCNMKDNFFIIMLSIFIIITCYDWLLIEISDDIFSSVYDINFSVK